MSWFGGCFGRLLLCGVLMSTGGRFGVLVGMVCL